MLTTGKLTVNAYTQESTADLKNIWPNTRVNHNRAAHKIETLQRRLEGLLGLAYPSKKIGIYRLQISQQT